jgi:hypothetical protein
MPGLTRDLWIAGLARNNSPSLCLFRVLRESFAPFAYGSWYSEWIPAFAGMAGSRRLDRGCAAMAGNYEPATFIRSIKIDPTVFAP